MLFHSREKRSQVHCRATFHYQKVEKSKNYEFEILIDNIIPVDGVLDENT